LVVGRIVEGGCAARRHPLHLCTRGHVAIRLCQLEFWPPSKEVDRIAYCVGLLLCEFGTKK